MTPQPLLARENASPWRFLVKTADGVASAFEEYPAGAFSHLESRRAGFQTTLLVMRDGFFGSSRNFQGVAGRWADASPNSVWPREVEG